LSLKPQMTSLHSGFVFGPGCRDAIHYVQFNGPTKSQNPRNPLLVTVRPRISRNPSLVTTAAKYRNPRNIFYIVIRRHLYNCMHEQIIGTHALFT